MTDSNATELEAIIEVLEKLASAISWTMPTDTKSVRDNLTEAFDAIDKLKEALDEQE